MRELLVENRAGQFQIQVRMRWRGFECEGECGICSQGIMRSADDSTENSRSEMEVDLMDSVSADFSDAAEK